MKMRTAIYSHIKGFLLFIRGLAADIATELTAPLFYQKAFELAKKVFTQHDKRTHFIAGFALSIVVGTFLLVAGLLTGVISGALKEVYDATGRGCVEALDFAATVIGASCAVPFYIILNIIIF